MPSALPLAAVPAWRVYLDLPMHGRRQLPGGLEEMMRLGYQDAVLKVFEPQVTQAADEFPGVLAELRARLPVTDGPIGVVGASVGALPAQLVMAGGAADDPAFAAQAGRLATGLRQHYRDPRRASLVSIPGMKHAFAAEPGIEPAPQTPEAELVDAAVTGWFSRHLR